MVKLFSTDLTIFCRYQILSASLWSTFLSCLPLLHSFFLLLKGQVLFRRNQALLFLFGCKGLFQVMCYHHCCYIIFLNNCFVMSITFLLLQDQEQLCVHPKAKVLELIMYTLIMLQPVFDHLKEARFFFSFYLQFPYYNGRDFL